MQPYVMIGAGGTGTHLLRPLYTYLAARDHDWTLHIIDGDTVETHNLARQAFRPGDVTQNKAKAAAADLEADLSVIPHDIYLSEDNITTYIQNGDIVLICADNMVVRRRIEDHCRTLDNVVVINGGNEEYSGSVQLWVREDGRDITPRISYLHPEVAAEGPDRAQMTCAEAAALPGGAQTIIANLQSATWMLTALWRYHEELETLHGEPGPATWTELQFDAREGTVEHVDQRMSAHWRDPA